MKVNLKKLTKREIDFYCKNNEENEARNDRKEDCIDNRTSISNMGSPLSTPRKAPKRTATGSRLSSSKKKMSAVKNRTVVRESSMFDIGSSPSGPEAQRNNSQEVEEDAEEDDPMFFGSPKRRGDPVVNTPTKTPNKFKLKQPKVVIRHTKESAKLLRNLSQEYLREKVEHEKKAVGMDEDKAFSDYDSGTNLPPPICKSQSDMFSTQLEAPHPGPAFMLGQLVNENLPSDEDTELDPETPSLVMDISRDLFSQSQSQEDFNANDDTPQQEEEYHCLLCDEIFKEKTDHEKHVRVCMQRRPAPSLPPSSSKLKRPRSPSPRPSSPAPVLAPRSPPLPPDSSLAPSVHKPKLAKIPKLKVSLTESDITVIVTNSFASRDHLRNLRQGVYCLRLPKKTKCSGSWQR